ncbi:zinc metallopeptidase [Leadbettera azotonutricia]|uniref:Neutral zinc metallopeptidase n=1 Tax=Leadbettera azotonutricia (strain ATCC BAA-888 / DSM 13862 / ZAS-9) TaxID=545695 RepID=F5YGG6_LEAAZ|nr:zinc metallopeptidase [Leadbettera azotonutricia]AEF82665.1 neutral zinc metallopeptidase [Leadbettera azotonutricia ZAS-9]
MYFDYYYVVLVVPTIILSLIAQILVKSTFSKYSKIRCSRGITGKDAASLLMRANNIRDVSIQQVRGNLTDHYDPGAKVLRLSDPVFGNPSIAAVGVAAHETGHAIQHATSYGPLALRSSLVPIANIGSTIGPWIAIAGIFLSFPVLINIGIVLFGGAVVFYLITLPVEFNASARALSILKSNNVLSADELRGVRKVLTAAALTYVASALTALMSFVRLILLAQRRRR